MSKFHPQNICLFIFILINLRNDPICRDSSELQDIEEEDIIEEYLDEYLDEIKSENTYNVYADHQYTNIIVEEEIVDEESNEDSINFEDTFESDVKTGNSKKQYHKFHQLTGLTLFYFYFFYIKLFIFVKIRGIVTLINGSL